MKAYQRINMKRTPEYRAWDNMIQRCYNPNYIRPHLYSDRGIQVCSRWRESFENFLLDVGNRPSKKHSLDRINFNGDYEPGNVRWATIKQQANNRRDNVIYKNIVESCVTKTVKSSGEEFYTVRCQIKNIKLNLGRYNSLEEALSALYTAKHSV